MGGYNSWLDAAKNLFLIAFGDLLDEDDPRWFDDYCDNLTPQESVEKWRA